MERRETQESHQGGVSAGMGTDQAPDSVGVVVPPPPLRVPSTREDDSDTDVEIERPPSTVGVGVPRNGPVIDSAHGHVSRPLCGGGKQGFASVTDSVVVESASALDGRVMTTEHMKQLLGRLSGVATRYVSRIDPVCLTPA